MIFPNALTAQPTPRQTLWTRAQQWARVCVWAVLALNGVCAVGAAPPELQDFEPAGYVEALGAVPAEGSLFQGLAVDPQGWVWTHSATGTLRYDGHALVPIQQIYPWMAGQSLPRPGRTYGAGFQIDPQGRLWVAGENSVVVADPLTRQLRTVLQRSLKDSQFELYRQGQAMVIRESAAPHTRLWHVAFGPQLRLGPPLVLPDAPEDRLPVPVGVSPQRMEVLLPALNERRTLSPSGQITGRNPVDPALAGMGPWQELIVSGASTILGGETGDLLWDGQTLKELWPRARVMGPRNTAHYAPLGWISAQGDRPPVMLSSVAIYEVGNREDDVGSIWFMDRGHVTITAPQSGLAPIKPYTFWSNDRSSLARIYLPGGGWHFLRDTHDPENPKPIVNVEDLAGMIDGDTGLWTLNRGSQSNSRTVHFSSTRPGVQRYFQPEGATYSAFSAGPGLACTPNINQLSCHDPVARKPLDLKPPESLTQFKGRALSPVYIDAQHIYAVSSKALLRVDRAGTAWEIARPAPGQASLPSALMQKRAPSGASAAVGPTQQLWFGDQDGQLIEWDVKNNLWQRVQLPAHPLLDSVASRVLDDQGLWVWFQSHDRLFRYNPTTRQLELIPELSSRRMEIARSGRGRLWLLTDNEVLSLDEDSGDLKAIDLPAPIRRNLGPNLAALGGHLYLATPEGLLSIRTDAPAIRQAVPPPQILKLDWVDAQRSAQSSYVLPDRLQLHYTSSLNVVLATRLLLPGDGVQYRYRLREAGDSSAVAWHELPPGESLASLNSMYPGQYVLEFSARRPWTPWVNSQNPLTLEVLPAPWQTAWARTGMVLTALLLVGGGLLLLHLRVRIRVSAAQRVAHNLVAHVSEGIVLMDTQQRVVLANEASRQLLGRSLDSSGEFTLQDVLATQTGDTPLTLARIASTLERKGQGRFEMILPPKADSSEPVMLAVSFQRLDTDSGQPGCAMVLTDITASKAQERELLHRAHYDGLTHLSNRSYFGTCLQQALAEATAQSTAVALLYLDIDHFRDVNDTRGHQAGDALLVTLARRLSDAAPPQAQVARFGGDEFAVLLRCTSTETAIAEILAAAHHLHDAIRLPWEHDGLRLQPTASSGVAIYPLHAHDAGELFQFADLALYESKRLGRNRTELFNDSLMAVAQRRVDLVAALKIAIPRGELRLFLQPKVCASTLQVCGAEALVRWARDGQFVSPGDFIPLAESSGLIAPIGQWMQDSVCRWLRQRQDAGHRLLPISINASSTELETPGFARQIQSLLQRYRLPADMLEIEVTESALFRERDLAIAEMGLLRDLGVAVVADDFGTGYASLSYLTEFPLSGIKIDPTILRSMAQDERRRTLVSGLVRNVMSLGMSAVAEGVETLEQQELARDLGVSALQGWLYAKAVPAEHFAATVATIRPDRAARYANE